MANCGNCPDCAVRQAPPDCQHGSGTHGEVVRYQMAGDIKSPYAPEPVPDPSERDFTDLVFEDG